MNHPEIEELLARLERDYAVKILYACESGSRAWGFESPDSDFDIRFIFIRPGDTYLSVKDHFDSIERPLEGLLDAGGWDVRKSLRLLTKSNGALVEWLHSPIVYRNTPGFLDRWRTAAKDVFSCKASSDHYRGLAKQMIRGKLATDKARAKDYLYALRALLSASWVDVNRTPPPVPFDKLLHLLPVEVASLIPDLLAYKARSAEGDRMDRIVIIDDFLEERLADLEERSVLLPRGPEDMAALDRLFREEIAMASPVKVPASSEFTLEHVREPSMLLFETVAGSKAYGTDLPGSDEDLRGVFIAPPSFIAGLDHIEQVSDDRGDEVYYELGRFVELLLKNNPNALELLGMPDDCVRHVHPLYNLLDPRIFLSKLCAKTFGEYAMGQIRKARGLNKKIVNPQPEIRKTLLDFCHVPEGQGSVPLMDWLSARSIDPKHCGLTSVTHAAGIFAIYHDPSCGYRGLVSPKDPDSLVFSSVPFEAQPIGWMHCNQDAFQAHCKAHRDYWEWVSRRNEERYQTNAEHGRGYDSKNLMHTLRLLDMAGEIANEGVLRVRRPNRDFLLRVRAGEFSYDELVERAEAKLAEVNEAFDRSSLPDVPDRDAVNDLLAEIRTRFSAHHVI